MKRKILTVIVLFLGLLMIVNPVLAAVDYYRPTIPDDFLATPVSSSQISLTWQKGTYEEDEDATIYTAIFHSESWFPEAHDPSDTDWELLYFGTGTSFTHSGLQPGTSHFYSAWTFCPDVAYVPHGSFPSGTEVYTPEGMVEIQDLEEDDIIYIYDEELNDGTLIEVPVKERVSTAVTSITDLTVGGNTYRSTRAHRYLVLNVDPLWFQAQGITALFDELIQSDSTTIQATERVNDTISSTIYYDISHWGNYSNIIIGDDLLVVASTGVWSEDYGYDFATTLLGKETDLTVPMPPEWFQTPACTAFEKLPIYDGIVGFAEGFEIPLNNFCVMITLGMIFGLTLGGWMMTRTTMIVLAIPMVAIVIAAIVGMLPLWFLAFEIVLGGLLIYIWLRA